MTRTGEARAFGNALLGAIYAQLGGDGRRVVRFDTRKAAQVCTGEVRPTQVETKYVRELLHQLVALDLTTWRITHNEELEEFSIEPRRRAPTRLPPNPDTDEASP
jgi:hypothetical protein